MNIQHKTRIEKLNTNSQGGRQARIFVDVFEGGELIGSVVVCSGPYDPVFDYYDGRITFAELRRELGFKG